MLERLGVPFSVQVPGVAELQDGPPELLTVENALRKARAVHAGHPHATVLGCDTVVVLDGRIHGKPADAEAARETLRALGGRTHEVISGIAVLLGERTAQPTERTAFARTAVSFRALSERLLDWYLALGEWRGRAGGYAIQGAGAALVDSVAGDYENVVGLPLARLLDVFPELLEG